MSNDPIFEDRNMDNDAITYHPVTLFQNFLHGANVSKERKKDFARGTLRIAFDRVRSTLKSAIENRYGTMDYDFCYHRSYHAYTLEERAWWREAEMEDGVSSLSISLWARPILAREEKFPWQSVREGGRVEGRWRGR